MTHHTKFREETRWPGYYYRGDYPPLDYDNWHCLTLGRYNPENGDWEMEKAPVHHLVYPEDFPNHRYQPKGQAAE